MIRFACPKCDKVYRAEPDQVGRQTVCKQCGAVVVVPQAGTPEPAEPPPTESPRPAQAESLDFRPPAADQDDDVPIRSRRKTKTPPLGLLLIVGLALALAVVAVIAVRRQSGDRTNPPPVVGATERERPNWTADDGRVRTPADALRETAFWYVSALACYFAFVVIYLAVSILLAIWVLRDCRNRAEEYGFFWMLLIFPMNVLGLAIYLGSRPSGELKACENCGHRRLEYLTFCPHCRYDFQAEGRKGCRKK